MSRSGFADSAVNRRLVELRRSGMRVGDIAVTVGLTYGAVRTRLYEARRVGLLPHRGADHVRYVDYDEAAAWEARRRDLAEAHRAEFLARVYRTERSDPWAQSGYDPTELADAL